MRSLVPISAPGALSVALSRRCDIVASTLETLEQAEIIQFFREYPELFGQCVQRYYPLTEAQLARYADQWDWELLSENAGLPWSIDLLEQFAETWDWGALSYNSELPWGIDLIERFADKWYWHLLSEDYGLLPWSIDLIERYADKWDWGVLSKNSGLPWSKQLFRQFETNWHMESVSKLQHFDLRVLSEKQIDQLLRNIFIDQKPTTYNGVISSETRTDS